VVRIQPGLTFAAVADTLTARGLLRHRWLFRMVARLSGRDRLLQAGRYRLAVGLAPRDLLAALVQGRTLPVRITLPEGISAAEASRLVADALACDAARFLAAADSVARAGVVALGLMADPGEVAAFDSLLYAPTPDRTRTLHWAEGYLAPDTYHFAEGTSATDAATTIVGLGLARLDTMIRRAEKPDAEVGLTPHEVLTLASIVEAEARLAGDRPLVAAVFRNRLRQGWRLDADPCLAYLLQKKGRRLLYRDLQVPSPYNTYLRAGLPPGPIGNPGREALAAVLEPGADERLFFFVADGQGGHVFSRTRAAHEQAVRAYRRARDQSPR